MRYFLLPFLLLIFSLKVQALTCNKNGSVVIPNEEVCVWPVSAKSYYDLQIGRCQLAYGIPAKITNAFEHTFVQNLMSSVIGSKSFYIGVVRTKTNRTWTYLDGSPLLYQNWDDFEPKTSNSDLCAHIDGVSGKWQAGDCKKDHAVACTFMQDLSDKCDNGWTYFEKTNSCYFVNEIGSQMFNWSRAEAFCASMDAHLVSIHSAEENNFVYAVAASNAFGLSSGDPYTYRYAWMGYYGEGGIGNGKWTDGSPVDYFLGDGGSRSYYWTLYSDYSCRAMYGETGWNAEDVASTEYPRCVCKKQSSRAG